MARFRPILLFIFIIMTSYTLGPIKRVWASDAPPNSQDNAEKNLKILLRIQNTVVDAKRKGQAELHRLLDASQPIRLMVQPADSPEGAPEESLWPGLFIQLSEGTPPDNLRSEHLYDSVPWFPDMETYEQFHETLLILEALLVARDFYAIQWLSERNPSVNVTRFDIYIFATIMYSDFSRHYQEPAIEFWKASRPYWLRMRNSKNPVYRLMALRNAANFSSGEELMQIYESGLRERESIFHGFALEGLLQHPSPEGARLVRDFLDRQRNDGTWHDAEWTSVPDLAKHVIEEIATGGAAPEEEAQKEQ